MSPIGYSAATLMQPIQETSAITFPQLHPGFVPHRSEPEETLQLIAYTWMTGIKLASMLSELSNRGMGPNGRNSYIPPRMQESHRGDKPSGQKYHQTIPTK